MYVNAKMVLVETIPDIRFVCVGGGKGQWQREVNSCMI
jgi:hypothetical protein